MKNKSFLVMAGALSALLFLMVACGGASVKQDFPQDPDWFNNPIKGCGVGMAKVRGIAGHARNMAISDARTALAQSLKTVVQSMIKRYVAEGEAKGKDFSEELSSQVTRNITEETLRGTRIVKTERRGNQYYAMICLDPETFGDAFDRMNELSMKERAALKARAKAEFQDMDKQLEKLHQRGE